MMSARPIVIDENNVVLGGNMRLAALKEILKMEMQQIESVISESSCLNYEQTIKFWAAFKQNHKVNVVSSEGLTELQKKMFIIKDNEHYGENDFHKAKKLIDYDTYYEYSGDEIPELCDYEAINDQEYDIKTERIRTLKIANLTIPLTEEEEERLIGVIEKYNALKGDNKGFLNYLTNGN